jgi:hypothetical protein
MSDELTEIAAAVRSLDERVGDLIYRTLQSQVSADDEAPGARDLERELQRARRSLSKASQILTDLARA